MKKVIFLDIDGVLNNGIAQGVFHESSTKSECIEVLNEITNKTKADLVVISSWKDAHSFLSVKKILIERGVSGNIIGCTEKDVKKEQGILNFFKNNYIIDKFVIIDDDLNFVDEDLKYFHVKTETSLGLQKEQINIICEYLL